MLPTHVLLSCMLFHSLKVAIPNGIWLREGLTPHPHPLLCSGPPGRALPTGRTPPELDSSAAHKSRPEWGITLPVSRFNPTATL